MTKEEVINEIIEVIQNMEWGVIDNSIDARILMDKLNSLKNNELINQETQRVFELEKEVSELKLKYENEVLNSESLQRYWSRTKQELEALKAKHKEDVIIGCKDPMVCLRGCSVKEQTCRQPIYKQAHENI